MNLIPKLNLPTLPAMPEIKLGSFPSMDTFIPEHPITWLGVSALALATIDYAHWKTDGDQSETLLALGSVLLIQYLYGRHSSRAEREGYLFDIPYKLKRKKVASNANWEITKHLKENGIDTIATESRSEQYRIIKIENKEPALIEKQISAISMMLGIDEKELKFIQNYQKGTSAILAPLPNTEWKTVSINKDALQKGKLIGFIGNAINGNTVTYDRRIEPHLLVAGDTNSGKTEAIRVDMESMRLSGLNPEIYIIDPKEDMENEQCEFYTSDIHEGVTLLEDLAKKADARKSKYNKAGCKNYFEYQERVDSSEKPLMIYIDETADLLAPDLLEKLEKGDHPLHKRAFQILYYISRKNRAGGLFLTFGIQHPKATTLPTEIRNNLGAKLVLSMADHTASKVALGKTGAETLPKFGAFMFKTSLSNAPIIGRGAYIN